MEQTNIIGNLFEIRTQAHWLHLQTKSYEEHKALDSFYNGWLELTDSFIETYFGRYGRTDGTFLNAIKPYSGTNIMGFINEAYNLASNDLKGLVKTEDMDLLNIIADMQTLCNRTIYFLSLK